MIIQHMPALNAKRIVLASGSPRRREILNILGKPLVQLTSLALDGVPRMTAVCPHQGAFALSSKTHVVRTL